MHPEDQSTDPFETTRANQIRKARKRFAEGGGENIEYLVLQVELQGEDIRQEEEQNDGQNDENHCDPCVS